MTIYRENFAACRSIIEARLGTLPEGQPVRFPEIVLWLAAENRVLSPHALGLVVADLVKDGILDRLTRKNYRKHLDEPEPAPVPVEPTLEALLEAMAALTARVEHLENELGVSR